MAESSMKKLALTVLLVAGVLPALCHGGNGTLETDISVNCSRVDCLPNTTRYDHVPSDPPLWCPEGYSLLNMNGDWFQLCRLQPCVVLSAEDTNTTTDSSAEGATVTINQTSSTATFCLKSFSASFETCPKSLLKESQYDVTNATLLNLVTNTSVPLGEYYIRNGAAVVCGDGTMRHNVIMPVWCMPLEVAPEDFRIANDSHLHVDRLGVSVARDYYSISDNASGAHVCSAMDPALVSCKKRMARLDSHLFSVLPTMEVELHKSAIKSHKFPLGLYIVAQDRSALYYCPDVKEPVTKETLYIYGITALLSAFCLLLAMAAHMFFPNLNYHTRALLCLAFSLFVTFIAIAVRNFSGNLKPGAGNVVLFAVQYIFALGAFFWLNVLAFDLWRCFNTLKGNVGGGSSRAKRRIFLAKCSYAWGIPALLCAIVIGVSYSPRIQQALYVDFELERVSWFHEATSCAIFFYTPIIIILVENVVFFILTIVNIKKASSGTDILHKKVSQKLFKVYIKLFLVMGIFWIAEVISWFARDLTQETTWYFTDIINSLQGVFIFLVYVCKRKTLKIIRNKLGYESNSGTTQSSSTSHARGRVGDVSLTNLQKPITAPTS